MAGKNVGRINFVAIDPNQGKMIGLVFQQGFWQKTSFVVLPKYILEAGGGLVTIKNEEVIEPLKEIIRAERLWQDKLDFFGLPAITESGKKLGYLRDMLVDRESFYVHRFYIQHGEKERILSRDLAVGVKDRKLIFKDEALTKPDLKSFAEPSLKPRPLVA